MKVLIIIPTYQEAASVNELLDRLERFRVENSLAMYYLVIDSNSPDGTSKIISNLKLENLELIVQSQKDGIGPAYRVGFEKGFESDFDFFVQMDADLSHQPEQLLDLLNAADNHHLIIGSRWIKGGAVINWPSWRRYVSKFGTGYASKILNLRYKDLTSGFRVLPRDLVKELNFDQIKSRGYGFQIEVAMQAVNLGFEIKEIPITFTERQGGKSKMTPGIIFEAWKMVTIGGIKRLFKYR